MTRKTKTNETPTIVLKTIERDIHRDNKNATITCKKMRVKLRATPSMMKIHEKNSSWIFTQSQYDDVRSMFDAQYAQRIANRAKRDAKKNDTKSNVAPTTNAATNEIA